MNQLVKNFKNGYKAQEEAFNYTLTEENKYNT